MAEDGDNDEAVPSSGKRKLEDTYNNFSTAIKSQRATSSHGDRAHSLDDFYQGERRSTTSDDPSLHQGRVRKNQHVQGNFPSFVQISCKNTSTVDGSWYKQLILMPGLKGNRHLDLLQGLQILVCVPLLR